MTRRKRQKVESDQEDDGVHADQAKRKQTNKEASSIGGHPSSVEDSVHAPSDEEEEEGTDGNMTKLHIPGSAKSTKGKLTKKEASNSGDSEVIEDDNSFCSHDINELEKDQSSEEESSEFIDSEAVEDNDHHEFEEDFDGEDSEEEAYGVDRTDEDVQGSDSETDASDGNESDDSFVVNDDSVEYTQENDSLDQLDEAAEIVSKRRGTTVVSTYLHECCPAIC